MILALDLFIGGWAQSFVGKSLPSDLLQRLAIVSLRVTVLLLFVLASGIAMRRMSAALRHRLYAFALLGTLIVPILWATFPTWSVPFLMHTDGGAPVESHRAPMARLTAELKKEEFPLTTRELSTASRSMEHGATSIVLPSRPQLNADGDSIAQSNSLATDDDRYWFNRVLAIWATGVLIGLCRCAVGCVVAVRLIGKTLRVADCAWLADLAALSALADIGRRVELLRTERSMSPFVWGAFQPRIIVPDVAAQWSAERRRSVLLHELAHIRRGDLLWQMLAGVACAVWWFNPLVWFVAAELRKLSDQAADDFVVQSGQSPAGYAYDLLAIASCLAGTRCIGPAQAIFHGSQLETRLSAILNPCRNRRPVSRGLSYGALAISVLVVIPVAMLTPRVVHAEPSTQLVSKDKPRSLEPQPARVAPPDAFRHVKLKLRVLELSIHGKDGGLFEMNPDTSHKWHPLLSKTRDEVNAILNSADLVADPNRLHDIRQQLVSGRLIVDSPGYQMVTIATDGRKFREDWEGGGSTVFNGKAGAILDFKNRQAKIPRARPSQLLERLERGPYGRLSVHGSVANPTMGECIVNEDGTLRRSNSYYLPEAIWVERTLYGYKSYSDGYVFPTVHIYATYGSPDENRLFYLSILVIEEAHFGAELPNETFQAAVPKNTALWDDRHGLKLRAITEPVADVLTQFEE